MKSTTIPALCSVAITAMLSAGISHWWSVSEFVAVVQGELPMAPTQSAPANPPVPSPSQVIANRGEIKSQLDGMSDRHKQEFYEALIGKLANMENQNRDLLDQLAETNRDLMKLEFRVDTHSESFRPMPLEELSPFSSIDGGVGVLPPRAEPISLPSYE